MFHATVRPKVKSVTFCHFFFRESFFLKTYLLMGFSNSQNKRMEKKTNTQNRNTLYWRASLGRSSAIEIFRTITVFSHEKETAHTS